VGPETRERIRPGHVAILVRTHRHAAVVREALERAGVPAVINGAGSVFGAPIAREWLRLLEALERPASAPRARSVALTAFLGLTAEQIATPDETLWEGIHAKLHEWAGVLRRRGVASLLEVVTLTESLPGRLLARRDGERELTDLRHVGQLLHAQATSEQLGVTALAAWLRSRVAEAPRDTDNEERSRRLDSDAEAVQVLTIHRSKGLEFPVVYHPYLWEPGFRPDGAPVVFHDPAAGDARTLDVGLEGPSFLRHEHQSLEESRGEDLRLAYVALTRAKHQAIVWWAGSYDSRDSPLGRLLFARDADGNVAVSGASTPSDDQVTARFEALAVAAPGRVSVERVLGGRDASWYVEPSAPATLSARAFERRLDTTWRRTSYSGITSAAHGARVGSEPDETVMSDEPTEGEAVTPAPAVPDATPDPHETQLRATGSLLAELPGGVDMGTFVHRIMETTDFTAADLAGALAATIDRERARGDVDVGDGTLLARALQAAIETPLGPLVDDLRLRDLGPADRLDELGFELPLVGGDAADVGLGPSRVTLDDFASLLEKHLPPDDPLSGYPSRLRDPVLHGDLRGYLSGSLDLVARTRDSAGQPRFAVIDHKTNWLGVEGETLSSWHYRPAALGEAMQRAHYPLQALLYSVALHRYLRWRLSGYAPERHLAGVFYLFLRGMSGNTTPRVNGQP
ncbi:MAG: 3'-5' exonuclease, partial [Acidimicrobiia bacterium]